MPVLRFFTGGKIRHFDILTGNSIDKNTVTLQTEFDISSINRNFSDKKGGKSVYITSHYRVIRKLLKLKIRGVFMQICTAGDGNAQACAWEQPRVFKSFAHSAQSFAQTGLCKRLRNLCIGSLHKSNLPR